jgi:intein/homing endonuclease
MAIDLMSLPREVRDKISLREQTDPTFYRFLDEDFSDDFWNTLNEKSDVTKEKSIIISVYGEQGCLSKGTMITTKRGLVEIENIVRGDFVWTRGGWKKCNLIKNGVAHCKKIVMRNKTEIIITENHKVLVGKKFVSVRDLVLKDKLKMGNMNWSDEWKDISEKASLLGMILADGHIGIYDTKTKYVLKSGEEKIYHWKRKDFSFYNDDEGLRSILKKGLKRFYGINKCKEKKDVFKGKVRTTVVQIAHGDLMKSDLLKRLESDGVPMGKKSGIIEIPSWIQKDDAAMNGFLAGYFSCDGSNKVGNGVEISSCSEKLIRQIAVWLHGKGVAVRIKKMRAKNDNQNDVFELFILVKECVDEWVAHVPNLKKNKCIKKKILSDRKRQMNSFAEYQCEIISIEDVGEKEVYDLQVSDMHEYLANGFVVHNSGKSYSAISMCFYVDPNFSVDRIYFSYDALVRDRANLKPHTAVLLDEQTQSYGLDSTRVMLILNSMKDQLRKKSIHLFFCSPTLHTESSTSNYIIEVMFIDHETNEAYAALKTRDGLTLGHIRIPSPLKVLEDGNSFATEAFMKEYEAKKDAHIEHMLGQKNVDTFEDVADAVIVSEFFKKAEKVYRSNLGYMPRDRVVQVVNKLYPEYHSGVMSHEVAERIRMKMEMSGKWRIPSASGTGRKSKK